MAELLFEVVKKKNDKIFQFQLKNTYFAIIYFFKFMHSHLSSSFKYCVCVCVRMHACMCVAEDFLFKGSHNLMAIASTILPRMPEFSCLVSALANPIGRQ